MLKLLMLMRKLGASAVLGNILISVMIEKLLWSPSMVGRESCSIFSDLISSL
jgi:hypothetical protein